MTTDRRNSGRRGPDREASPRRPVSLPKTHPAVRILTLPEPTPQSRLASIATSGNPPKCGAADHARLDDSDRAFRLAARRRLEDRKEHPVIVKPDSVLRWHRDAFRRFWATRSAGMPRRPPVAPEVVAWIRRLSSENVLPGAPRIASELALLGQDLADSTVATSMLPTTDRPPSQTWRTFLRSHRG